MHANIRFIMCAVQARRLIFQPLEKHGIFAMLFLSSNMFGDKERVAVIFLSTMILGLLTT